MDQKLFRAIFIHKTTGKIRTKHFSGEDLTASVAIAKRYFVNHYCLSFVMTDISMKKVIMLFADREEQQG